MTRREREILRLIRDRGKVRVEDLVEHFGTTPQTIRKDLQRLEDAQQVLRFHGGATLHSGVEYMPFERRRQIATEAKVQIARAAASLIPANSSLFLNGGTTTEAIARELTDHVGLHMVVDNIDIANLLRRHPALNVVVPGGELRHSDGAVLGSTAVDFLRQFNMEFAFIGAVGVSDAGDLFDFDLRESQVARAMIQNARHSILVVDSSKFGVNAPVRVGTLDDIHTLVTDICPSEAVRAICASRNIRLIETGQGATIKRSA